MIDYTKQLHEELLLRLEKSETGTDLDSRLPAQRRAWVVEAIHTLREKLKLYDFENREEEIGFFKETLPPLLSLYMYYDEKFGLEMTELRDTPRSLYSAYDRVFNKIDNFFRENGEFLRYCRAGKTNLDAYYFLRSSVINMDNAELLLLMVDASFCPVYSFKIAAMIAYTRLENEIHYNITSHNDPMGRRVSNKKKLEWTASKTDLTELMYALKVSGSFNNGDADLSMIQEGFEKMCSIDLGNTSSSFQKILSRKTGNTAFLDKLRSKLDEKS